MDHDTFRDQLAFWEEIARRYRELEADLGRLEDPAPRRPRASWTRAGDKG
jgi:hypothetical protein